MSRHRTSPLLLILALLIASVSITSAQDFGSWERLGVPARDVVALWSGQGVLAAQKTNGTFLLSHDNGRTWAAPLGQPPFAVHVGENGRIAAVPLNGPIQFSSDNGVSFAAVENSPLLTGSGYLLGEGNHLLFAQKESEGTYRYHRSDDGGATWSAFLPKTSRVVLAIDPDGSYYSYDEQSRIYRYRAPADDWEAVGDAPEALYNLQVASDGRLYGVTYNGKLYRSDTGNFTLQPYASDLRILPFEWFAVDAAGTVYAVGISGASTKFIYRIADGGEVVDSIPTPLGRGEYYLFTDRKGALHTRVSHGGIQRVYRYEAEVGGWDIFTVDGYGTVNRLDAIGSDAVLALTADGLFVSQDAGEEFRFSNVPDIDRNSLSDAVLLGPQAIFASRTDADYRSTDNGESWTTFEPGAGQQLFRDDNGVLYSYHIFRTYRSYDQGSTWDTVKGVRPFMTMVSGSGDHLYLTGAISSMHYSADGGGTWTRMPGLEGYTTLQTAAVLTDGTFIGGAGTIEEKADEFLSYVIYRPGDSELMTYDLPCDKVVSEYRFAADAEGKAYLASACGLYRSDDGGRSWKWLTGLPANITVADLQITAAGDAYLGTDNGLFRLARVSSVDDRQGRVFGEVALNVLPNPLRDAGVVRFELGDADHVRIGLYDQSGRLVREIVDGQYVAGIHEIDLGDLQGISSGSYLLVVRAGDRMAEEKVFLLRDAR